MLLATRESETKMSESVIIQPQHRADDHDPGRTEPFRPSRPEYGPGRMLRKVAGLNETILDWVPEERPRYTRLGAIVVNTAVMAAFSMAVLLKTVDIPVFFIPVVALIWGYLILSFDGWLVASTHGPHLGGAKLRAFLPRLIISFLMGAVIAEPLLLMVFAPAIHTQINEERRTSVTDYESRLKDCNAVQANAAPPAADCTGFLLNAADSPDGVRQELVLAQAQRKTVQGTIEKINTELARREELARTECNGTKGAGLTGRSGEGPNCRRNRAEADRYRASSDLDEHQADLVAVNRRITELTAADGSATAGYTAAVNQQIADKVKEKREAQGSIGILDEDKALGTLASESMFVMVGSWLLRLLLIAIDCLPVLTKLMSRTTTYDALLGRQLDISNRLHEKSTELRERHDSDRAKVGIHRAEHRYRTAMEEINEASREARAEREAGLDDEIEALAARLRGAGA